ncbi:MAG: FkbM family methyltransferase [Terriglobia bacterium]
MREIQIPGINRPLRLHTHTNSDPYISEPIERDGVFEPSETQVIVQCLREGDTFFDIGANIGYYSVIAAARVGPRGKVFAFEPEPENFHLLRKNVEANSLTNVHTVCRAVSSSWGTGRLFLSGANRGDHRLYDPGEQRREMPVQCIYLDSFVAASGARVDFVKMDVQGSETKVLLGMRDTLMKRAAVLKMTLEFWPYGLAGNGSSPAELLSLLPQEIFDCYVIDNAQAKLLRATHEQIMGLCEQPFMSEQQGHIDLLVTPKSWLKV